MTKPSRSQEEHLRSHFQASDALYNIDIQPPIQTQHIKAALSKNIGHLKTSLQLHIWYHILTSINMCYVFTDKIEEQARLVNGASYTFNSGELSVFPAQRNTELKTTSLKRLAESDLEHERVKVTKYSDTRESSKEQDQSTAAVESKPSQEELTTLRSRIRQLEKDNKALEEKNNELNIDLCEYRLKEDKYKVNIKAERDDAKAAGKQAVQNVRESVNTDWTTKHERMRHLFQKKIDSTKKEKNDKIKDLQEKHDAELAKKDDACKKKVDELKAKNQQLEKDTKESKAEHAKAEKELKAEHQRIQKELKSEQQEKIKEWKPDHSRAVKEKEALLKAMQKEIVGLKQERDTSSKQLETLKGTLDHLRIKGEKLEADAKEKGAAYETLEKESDTLKEQLQQLAEDNEKTIHSYNNKLKREGEKWQVQRNRAEGYAQARTTQQRINFIQRDALNRSTEQVKDLEMQLAAEKAKNARLPENSVAASDAVVQTGETGEEAQLGGEGQEVKHLRHDPVATPTLDDDVAPPSEGINSSEGQGEQA